MVPPVDPCAGFQLDMLGRAPGSATVDQLRLIEPMDRLRDGIVEAVPLGADRTDRACLRQPLGVADDPGCTPRSEWWMRPLSCYWPRCQSAIPSASRASSACSELETRQPTMWRLKRSVTKAT